MDLFPGSRQMKIPENTPVRKHILTNIIKHNNKNNFLTFEINTAFKLDVSFKLQRIYFNYMNNEGKGGK